MTGYGKGKTGYPDNGDAGKHKEIKQVGFKEDEPEDKQYLGQHQGDGYGAYPLDILPVPVDESGFVDMRKRGVYDKLHQPDKDNQSEIDDIKPMDDFQTSSRVLYQPKLICSCLRLVLCPGNNDGVRGCRTARMQPGHRA